jgi:hypothetical protein
MKFNEKVAELHRDGWYVRTDRGRQDLSRAIDQAIGGLGYGDRTDVVAQHDKRSEFVTITIWYPSYGEPECDRLRWCWR